MKSSLGGTTPKGTVGEEQASHYVRQMFGGIAGRYDLLNHLLSFNIDRFWRARTVTRVLPVLLRADARVLDLCCGTGDVMLALANRRGGPVMGSDFCHPMLREANRKSPTAPLFESDALALPLAAASLDLITCAFGFRNLANYRRGLEELFRVLRPGGMVAILEFSRPPNALIAAGYSFYSTAILPRLGGLISGSRDAYTYLPESVRKFPGAEALASEMRDVGFRDVAFERMTFGVVALHTGRVT